MRLLLQLTVAAAFTASCAPLVDDQAQAASNCPMCCLGCGLNGKLMWGTLVNELSLDGEANEAGARIVSVTNHAGQAVVPSIDRDRLTGRIGLNEAEPLQVNSTFTLEITEDGEATTHLLKIAAVSEVDHWVKPGATEPATAYHFQELVKGELRDVCPDVEPDVNVDRPPLPDNHFFALSGDRYSENGTVETGEKTDGWITLACKGSVPAKLHFARHTEASSTAAVVSTLAQRQGLTNVLRGDYCGNGNAYTVNNHPLRYLDANNEFSEFYPFDKDVQEFEALWDENGALCLDKPRLEHSNPELELSVTCGGVPIPECNMTAESFEWGDALFVSGNPQL